MSRFYVYTLVDSRTGIPFYVGKGTNNQHLMHVKHVLNFHKRYKKNYHKDHLIKEIYASNGEVLYDITECESEQHAFESEIALIQDIGLDYLTNQTPGGDQGPYQGKSIDQYNIYGELIETFPSAVEAALQFGKNYSSTISRACTESGTSKRPFGYIWSYSDTKPNFDRIWKTVRPVYQYTLDGEYINRFPSAIESAKQVLCNQRRSYEIRQAATKGWKCCGFRWKFP